MFGSNQDPEVLAALSKLFGAAARNGAKRPKRATDYLAMQQGLDCFEYTAAVDGHECTECQGADGLVVAVGKPNENVPLSRQILLIAFDHNGAPAGAAFGVEQAKQIVDRLGEAIAIAERGAATIQS